tara:strand:- start:974 stop:1393 length:420 start_codon:yes stop_codon:yes gene_type:complete
MEQLQLSPAQIQILVGNSAINMEFSNKVRELSRRLEKNNLNYNMWETMTDREHDIFSGDLFLDGSCATSVEDYVHGAVNSCGCPDVEEDLHHHSPALMGEIEKQNRIGTGQDVHLSEAKERVDSLLGPAIDDILAEILS